MELIAALVLGMLMNTLIMSISHNRWRHHVEQEKTEWMNRAEAEREARLKAMEAEFMRQSTEMMNQIERDYRKELSSVVSDTKTMMEPLPVEINTFTHGFSHYYN